MHASGNLGDLTSDGNNNNNKQKIKVKSVNNETQFF